MDFDKFISLVKKKPFAGKLSASQQDGLKHILDEWQIRVKAGRFSADLRHIAYALATTFWETGKKMVPVREGGGESYLRGKKYYPWVGEGLVQVTWEANARKFGAKKPGDCMSWPVALEALFRGMRDGIFTGKKLSTYFNDRIEDPINARRIINGTDKAAVIAGFYHDFLTALEATQDEEAPSIVPSMADKPEPIEHDPEPDIPLPRPKPAQPRPVETADNEPITDKETIAKVQGLLRGLGYYQVGEADGGDNGMALTEGAILAFRNDNKLPLVPTIDKDLLVALTTAKPKVVSAVRAEAKPAEVAAKVETVAASRSSKFWAYILAIPSMVTAFIKGVVDNFEAALESPLLNQVKEFFADNMLYVALGVLGIAGWIWYKSDKAEKGTVQAFKEGRLVQ